MQWTMNLTNSQEAVKTLMFLKKSFWENAMIRGMDQLLLQWALSLLQVQWRRRAHTLLLEYWTSHPKLQKIGVCTLIEVPLQDGAQKSCNLQLYRQLQEILLFMHPPLCLPQLPITNLLPLHLLTVPCPMKWIIIALMDHPVCLLFQTA